jgi:OmpA-OmpF porin, OOP family
MSISEHPTVNSLKQEIEICSQEQFTGRIDIEASQNRWFLYFRLGRLIWASGGLHWFRRWHRQLHQHCSQVDSSNINVVLDEINGARNNDYLLLIQWVKQQKIEGAQATNVIRSTVEEVLFDILQQEKTGHLNFARDDQDIFDVYLILLNPKQVLYSAQKDLDSWSQAGLAELSPNLALNIRQPEQLSRHTLPELTQTLITAIDGRRTLRELAQLLKQDPLLLIRTLGLYLQNGLLGFVEVQDQPPSDPFESSLKGSIDRHSQATPAIANEEKTIAQPLDSEPSLRNVSQTKSRFLPFGKWALPALALFLLGGGYTVWRSLNSIGGVMLPRSSGQFTLVGTDFSGHSTFRSIRFQKALKEVGITLNYQVASDEQSAKLLNQGSADLELTTLDQFLQHQSKGKIIGIISHSVGGDAVVLNTKRYPGLKSLLDLSRLIQQARSQKQQLDIVLPQNTPSEYLVTLLGAKFDGFKLSDFHVKKTANAHEDWKALHDSNQNVVATVLREPDITHARQEGYSVVLSSQDTPEEIVDVLVVSESLLKSQPENIAKLMEAYYRRVDADARDASQLKRQIAEESNLSPADATSVMQGIQFFSALKSRDWLRNGKLEKRIGSTAAILTLTGRLNQVPQAQALFTPQFINKAASNTEELIQLVRADNPKLADRLMGKEASPKSASQPSPIKGAPIIGDLKLQWDVKFDAGSTHLTASGQQAVNRIAQEISSEFNPQTVAVEVIGHTSREGSAKANQTLSQNRAQMVVAQLKRLGLPHAIIAEGKGFNESLPEISPVDPRNQRTEIRLVRLKG